MPNSADLKCAYNPIGYMNSILLQNCREKMRVLPTFSTSEMQ